MIIISNFATFIPAATFAIYRRVKKGYHPRDLHHHASNGA
jgi:hypothetical protein